MATRAEAVEAEVASARESFATMIVTIKADKAYAKLAEKAYAAMVRTGKIKQIPWIFAILHLIFILFLTFPIYATYVGLHCWPLLQIGVDALVKDEDLATRGATQIYICHCLLAMVIWCAVRCVRAGPGRIPDGPDWEEGSLSTGRSLPSQLERKKDGRVRICRKCCPAKLKPDRAHHCGTCGSCSLKMDHHCPWFGICIGVRNYKYFFLAVFYSALSLQWVFWTMLHSFAPATPITAPDFRTFVVLIELAWTLLLAAILTGYFILHCWLILQARTSIELFEQTDAFKTKKNDTDQETTPQQNNSHMAVIVWYGLRQMLWGEKMPRSPHCRGAWANLKAALGPSPVLWFLPISPPTHDGLHYGPAEWESDAQNGNPWPWESDAAGESCSGRLLGFVQSAFRGRDSELTERLLP